MAGREKGYTCWCSDVGSGLCVGDSYVKIHTTCNDAMTFPGASRYSPSDECGYDITQRVDDNIQFKEKKRDIMVDRKRASYSKHYAIYT